LHVLIAASFENLFKNSIS